MRKIGIEEEFMLVDPETGRLKPVAGKLLQVHEELAAQGGTEPDEDIVDQEAFLQQIETATAPCTSLDDLGDAFDRLMARGTYSSAPMGRFARANRSSCTSYRLASRGVSVPGR